MSDVYRSGASVLVLRPAKDGFELLLLRKPRKHDTWQLPQGGVEEGETVPEAAMRELQEEAGIAGCELLGQSTAVYCYDFPPSFRRFRPDNVCGQRIQFIYALAPVDADVVVDQHEIEDYAWVMPSEIRQYVDRQEYGKLVEQLYGEAISLL